MPEHASTAPQTTPPRIGLVGHGRMGRTLERLAPEMGMEVTTVVDPRSPSATHRSLAEARSLTARDTRAPQVWIDFSHPDAAWEHLQRYAAGDLPAVIGTTGWTDRLAEAEELFAGARAPAVWAGNFSPGVALFLRVVERAASLIAPFDQYDVGVHEVHHTGKADSPSGTALHVAEAVRSGWEERRGAQRVTTDRLDHPRGDDEVHLSSTRVGHVPGTHTVWFDSPEDTLELTHRARSRDGFARGALSTASWLVTDPPATRLWRFDELLGDRLEHAPPPG
ncbi:4-hydroxy-tetrahydrodipicolinate reductase [Kytococcus sp. Marseille-QA3725]